MRRVTLVSVIASFTAGFLLIFIPNTALAVTEADGPWTNFTVPAGGHPYRDRNWVTISPRHYAGTEAESRSGNAPTGYMGIAERLWRTNNVLCEYRGWFLNDGPAFGISAGTVGPYGSNCQHGWEYWSDGSTKFYNGNGYTGHDTKRSPSLNY